jgi:hypothetical protein
MVRYLILTFGAIIAITLLRGVIGLLGKAIGDATGSKPPAVKQPPTVEQIQCPTCGSWISPAGAGRK